MALGEYIARNAQLWPDRVGYRFQEEALTFAAFNQRVNRLVNALRSLGISSGDRICVLANNCLPYFELYGAAEKGACRIAPLNFRLTAAELRPLLQDVTPQVLFAQARYREQVDGLRSALPAGTACVLLDGDDVPPGWIGYEQLLEGHSDVEPDLPTDPADTAYLIFTSGTTGQPRAAELTHFGQWADAMTLALEMSVLPNDRHLAMMPLYHVGGRAIALAHSLRGAPVVVHDGFDAASVLDTIARYQITTTQVVPTMLAWVLDHPAIQTTDLSSLRLVWYASAPMPTELLRRALQVFGPIFVQGYGQTEAGPLATVLHPFEHQLDGPGSRRLASCGRAAQNVTVTVVGPDLRPLPAGEVGEMAIRSPFVMKRYWQRPELTAETLRDGWLLTGDLAYADSDGYLYIVDRKKDLIISGGENIYPREIEEVLYAHPAVLEAAVIGVPDELWGESVKALAVLRRDSPATAAELIAWCRERLAGYKRPKSVEFRLELPKSPSGKILKRELRKPYWAGQHRSV